MPVRRAARRRLILVPVALMMAGLATQCNVSGFSLSDDRERAVSVQTKAEGAADAWIETTGHESPAVAQGSDPRVHQGRRERVAAPEPIASGARPVGSAAPGGMAAAPGTEGPREIVCPEEDEARGFFFFSPATPVAGGPLRVIAVGDDPLPDSRMEIVGGAGVTPLDATDSWGGPPYARTAVLDNLEAGKLRFIWIPAAGRVAIACGEVAVSERPAARPEFLPSGTWRIEAAWTDRMEDLYAVWVGRLFRVDPGAKAGWRPLHQVIRDPRRNILYGHLGMREDDPAAKSKVIVRPDCADTPFFLRAYFAWKMRLPFGFRSCRRGDSVHGPQCDKTIMSNLTDETDSVFTEIDRFNKFIGVIVAHTVHSGTVRTVPEDEASDLYPVALSRASIRPGSVFVDPNGHVLVVTQWVEGTETRIGTLYAVDGHPDLTVSHKRFTPASFYFAHHLRTGGFKRHRPVAYERGEVRFLRNDELRASRAWRDYSIEQYAFASTPDFYLAVERLLNPEPLDPVAAYRAKMEALVELLEERVTAVQVAVAYMDATGWEEIAMPEGGAIFETVGPWEEYSTPARDLRLLLAMDELTRFPRTVQEHPDLFNIPPGKTMANVRAELDRVWEESRTQMGIVYRRSDGSEWRLTLGDIVDRADMFEQAYNPNDCIEVRWGAEPGSAEFATCARRAPWGQRLRMRSYRVWHDQRRRPSEF